MGLYKANRPSHLCCYEILHIPDAMEYSLLKFYDIIVIFFLLFLLFLYCLLTLLLSLTLSNNKRCYTVQYDAIYSNIDV